MPTKHSKIRNKDKQIDMVNVYDKSLKGTKLNHLDFDYDPYFDIKLLKKHPKNTAYFSDSGSANTDIHNDKITIDNNSYRETQASIKVNGIVDPLIVYPDKDGKYLIISGHRRYTIAIEEGIDRLPVRIIKNKLSEARQSLLIIDCNMHGRRFSKKNLTKLRKDRLSLYYKVIPALESRLEEAIKSKSKEIGLTITAEQISELTGISQVTATSDFTALRRLTKKKVNKLIFQEKGIDTDALYNIKKSLGHLKNKVDITNTATKKLAIKEINHWVKTLK